MNEHHFIEMMRSLLTIFTNRSAGQVIAVFTLSAIFTWGLLVITAPVV